VVAESVTDKAASDRQSDSTLSWIMMTRPGSDVLNGQCGAAVRQGDVGHAGLLSRRGQRQRRADDVENAGAIAECRVDRDAGENALVGAGDDDVPAGRDRPRWNKAGQQQLQALECCRAILPN
jgi:hypothetical protein